MKGINHHQIIIKRLRTINKIFKFMLETLNTLFIKINSYNSSKLNILQHIYVKLLQIAQQKFQKVTVS